MPSSGPFRSWESPIRSDFSTANLPFSCLLQLAAYLSFATISSIGGALLQEAREDALDKQEEASFQME